MAAVTIDFTAQSENDSFTDVDANFVALTANSGSNPPIIASSFMRFSATRKYYFHYNGSQEDYSAGVINAGQTQVNTHGTAIRQTAAREGYNFRFQAHTGTNVGTVQIYKNTLLMGDATGLTIASDSDISFSLRGEDGGGGTLDLIVEVNGSDVLTINDDGATYDSGGTAVLTGGYDALGNSGNSNTTIQWKSWSSSNGETVAPTYDKADTYSNDSRSITHVSEASDETSATVTHHRVATPASATAPTAVEVAAGQVSGGGSAPAGHYATQTVNSGVESTQSLTGLSFGVTYRLSGTVADESGNLTAVQHQIVNAVTEDEIVYETTVENLQSQTQFGLVSAGPSDTQLVGNVLIISTSGDDADFAKFRVTAYDATGGTVERMVTGTKDASGYTIANGDRVRIKAAYTTVQATLDDSGVDGRYIGAVTGTPTTTQAVIDTGVAYDGQFVNKTIEFTSGGVTARPVKISASVASTDTITYATLPAAPVATDEYVIY